MNTLEYKGYKGTIETEDDTLLGHVLGLKNVIISYEGKNIDELKDDFQNGIDNYVKIYNFRIFESLSRIY